MLPALSNRFSYRVITEPPAARSKAVDVPLAAKRRTFGGRPRLLLLVLLQLRSGSILWSADLCFEPGRRPLVGLSAASPRVEGEQACLL